MKHVNSDNFNLFSPSKERDSISLGLDKTKKVLQNLNEPCINVPAIHIVGTNGKGSISAFLESVLLTARINIGVTTSPHMLNICERIRVNKKQISKLELETLLKSIQNESQIFNLSPFELIICCALKFFESKKVDLLILEAGLGGRLDATTAFKLRPIIAFSSIGFDHKELLGESLEEITHEKVAVIEKGSTVISCKQTNIVEKIINQKVADMGAKIKWVKPLSEKFTLGLKGHFQRENAAVALGVINTLKESGWEINNEHIKDGFLKTSWRGRLEVVQWRSREFIIDSAHNPSAAKALARERKNWDYESEGIFWILGILERKDFASFIRNLVKPFDKILLVPIENQKSCRKKDIRKVNDLNSLEILEFDNLKFALEYLQNLKDWPSCNPVLTGSIYLVSEFIQLCKD